MLGKALSTAIALVALTFGSTNLLPASAHAPLTAGAITTAVCHVEHCTNPINYTAKTDPNKDLGKPGQYTSKATFRDRRVPSSVLSAWLDSCPDPSCGGSIEVFPKTSQAGARANYLQLIEKEHPGVFGPAEYDFVAGTTLLRVSGFLPPTVALSYERTFEGVMGLPAQLFSTNLPGGTVPAPEPGVGGTITVRGTLAQPNVVYTVRFDQIWTNLAWTDFQPGHAPVEVKVTVTTVGTTPLMDEDPSSDLTLKFAGLPGPADLVQPRNFVPTSTSTAYECPDILGNIQLLNPGHSVTGCAVFDMPSTLQPYLSRYSSLAETYGQEYTVWHLVWTPDGAYPHDQKSYEWSIG